MCSLPPPKEFAASFKAASAAAQSFIDRLHNDAFKLPGVFIPWGGAEHVVIVTNVGKDGSEWSWFDCPADTTRVRARSSAHGDKDAAVYQAREMFGPCTPIVVI